MKIICSVLVAFLAIQAIQADGTTSAPPKTCKDFLSEATCTKLQQLIASLKESSSTLQDAITAAVAKHKTKGSEMLIFVREYIAKNIQCNQVLDDSSCTKLNEAANRLKLTALQVKEAIEKAVASGKTTVTAIYNNAVTTLTGEISCEKILGADTCKKLMDAAKTLKEQRIVIQEALMTAAQKHINNAKDIAKSVRDFLVQSAANFKCADVLSEDQCTRLQDIATRFKLRAGELKKVLAEAIVNGKISATDLYKTTIGAFLDEAKDLECEDMLPQATCDAMDKVAANFKEGKKQVTEAVKEWVISGQEKVIDVRAFVTKILTDLESCKNFFTLFPSFCETIQKRAIRVGITFDKVTEKIRELYAGGKSSVIDIYNKIKEFISGGTVVKRSIEDDEDDEVVSKLKKFKKMMMEKLKKLKAEFDAKIKKASGPEARKKIEEAYKMSVEKVKKWFAKYFGKTAGTF